MGTVCQSTLHVRHTLDEIQERSAHGAVLDGAKRLHERMKLLGAKLRRERLKLGIAVGGGDELQDRYLKVRGKADEAVNRNAVFTVFILLHLLETHVEMFGDIALSLAGGAAGDANITPQIAVERTFGPAFGFSGHGANLRWVTRRFKDSDDGWSILKIQSHDDYEKRWRDATAPAGEE
jgi:hypothetical protein